MKNFLFNIFKNWKKIILIGILTAIASVIFGIVYNYNAFSATIFVNIGSIQNSTFGKEENPYDTLQAADQFTESMQGWFKNPAFLEKIRSESGTNVDLSVRKQEKQNLIITFKAASAQAADKIVQSTRTALENQLSVYNGRNASSFTMPAFDPYIKEYRLPLILFAFCGAVAGIFIGYFFSLFWSACVREYNLYRREKA